MIPSLQAAYAERQRHRLLRVYMLGLQCRQNLDDFSYQRGRQRGLIVECLLYRELRLTVMHVEAVVYPNGCSSIQNGP